jgi:alpha-1,3-mannosyltransferase
MAVRREFGAFVLRALTEWSAARRVRPALLLAGEAVLCAIIVLRVRYTPIDWRAYMQEVEGPVVHGVWDYTELRGETGPLVYPGGFIYLYAGLRALAGGDGSDIRSAQAALAIAYLGTMACAASAYAAARPRRVPPWTLLLLCVSLRLHSIYLLRLFNDCWAMLLAWAAVALFSRQRWASGCVCYSLGVGVKMNVFLFAPGLFLLLLKAHGALGAARHIALCALVQLALGAPFLLANPLGYVARAFGGFGDLNQKWSVNWKMLPPALFSHRGFALGLLAVHLLVLGLLATRRWCSAEGGLGRALRGAPLRTPPRTLARLLHPEQIVSVLLGCNAVGVVFSRSLHFQFYTWYWHALPFLLWRCDALATPLKLAALGLLEYAWSYGLDRVEGTSTPLSSAALQLGHALVLFALWRAPAPPAFVFSGDDALLVRLNNEHAAELAAMLARRGVLPDEARCAVLTAAGPDSLAVQLWDGSERTVACAGWDAGAPAAAGGEAAVARRCKALVSWLRRVSAE